MLPSLSRLPADTEREADGEGLTRVLKRTTLVPTGACLPRSFDPDYCAYDRYYAIGVSLVSTVMGALVDSPYTFAGYNLLAKALNETLGRLCHTPKEDGWVYPNPQAKQFRKMSRSEKLNAREDFGLLCHALEHTLSREEEEAFALQTLGSGFDLLVTKVIYLITKPGSLILAPLQVLLDPQDSDLHHELVDHDQMYYEEIRQRVKIRSAVFYMTYASTSAWTLKYISRFMNEHAMMVASFFRVNSKRLHSSQPLQLNLKAFAQMCKDDIANGPNPPPPLPTAEELAAAKAAAEAENRHQNDLVDKVMMMPTIMASYE